MKPRHRIWSKGIERNGERVVLEGDERLEFHPDLLGRGGRLWVARDVGAARKVRRTEEKLGLSRSFERKGGR